MKINYKLFTAILMLCCLSAISCRKHLMGLNENPNGADPATTNPNLVLSTVLTETGREFTNLGFGNIMGVMQYTQKDGWGTEYNNYDWGGDNPWANYYAILRNDQLVYDKALAGEDGMLQGISLVVKAMVFGLITDLYGDVPYEAALKGDEGGRDNTFPAYTPQQEIYKKILSTLDTAAMLLSKPQSEYTGSLGNADVYYDGDVTKWRKLANSLALRYYMRMAEKAPAEAKAGIEKIVNDPENYPLITSAADDAVMAFAGNSNADSWPTNATYDADSSNYRRVKMCNTFVSKLLALQDPRIAVWASPVQIFLHVNDNLPAGSDFISDTMVDGEARKVRNLSPDILSAKALTPEDINQNPDYVGLPVALTAPQVYNLSPDANQAAHNPHVSWLNKMYAGAKGPLLKARLMSAAEVHFIIAEAKAVKGWTDADAEQQYYAGIRASFDAWGVSALYDDYITHSGVKFNHSQQQIMEQKWIANWSSATEAWFDYRRTGFPHLSGVNGQTIAPVLPVRFYYPKDEQNMNEQNVEVAAAKLEVTSYSAFGAAGKNNSPWSKMWVLQGTGKPW